MTGKELVNLIQSLPEEQQDYEVYAVYDSGFVQAGISGLYEGDMFEFDNFHTFRKSHTKVSRFGIYLNADAGG